MGKPIQIIPEGLLGMFQIKNAGRNPQELIETIQPSLEMLDWYMSSYAELQKGLQFGPNAAQVWMFGIQIPATEFWFVHSISVKFDVGAGEDIECRIGFLPPGGSFLHPYGQDSTTTTLTVPNASVLQGVQPKTFYGPGTGFGITVVGITGAIVADAELWVTKFRR